MLRRLFPAWLFPLFRLFFSQPFPKFSLWMNTKVTLWTTNWLMGNAQIMDLDLENLELQRSRNILFREESNAYINSTSTSHIGIDQLLVVEKCRFLETTGCVQTCLNACKIPTQDFFQNEMGLNVTLIPCLEDLSCRFEFGVAPKPIFEDPIYNTSCLSICSQQKTGKESCSYLAPS